MCSLMPVSATRWHARHVTFGSGTRPLSRLVCNHHPPQTDRQTDPPFFLPSSPSFPFFPFPLSILLVYSFFSPPYLTSICITPYPHRNAYIVTPWSSLDSTTTPTLSFYLHILGIVTPIVGMHLLSHTPNCCSLSYSPFLAASHANSHSAPLPHKPCVLQVLAGNLASPSPLTR